MSLTTGTRLGPYEITSPIGAGGMGEVYRALDTRLQREVAIKVLPLAYSADVDRLRRFEQEARAAAALNHPNILAVHDVGTHDGAPYLVSELLDGQTLRDRLNPSSAAARESALAPQGLLPLRKTIDYAVQVAKGLAAAHEKGIVHRDLKPENLFVTADGRVKILDFGLAKLTEREPVASESSPTAAPATVPGLVLGTVGYMSPEQVRGQPVDHRSDVFAFGAILYEILGGRRAFEGSTAADTLTAILREDPPDLPATARQIPPALVRIVDRCLEKSPGARFQSRGTWRLRSTPSRHKWASPRRSPHSRAPPKPYPGRRAVSRRACRGQWRRRWRWWRVSPRGWHGVRRKPRIAPSCGSRWIWARTYGCRRSRRTMS